MMVFGAFAILLGIITVAIARRRSALDRDRQDAGDERYVAEAPKLRAYPRMNEPQSLRLGGFS